MTNKELLAFEDEQLSAFVLVGFLSSVVTCHFLLPEKTALDIAKDYLKQEADFANLKERENNV